MVFLVSNVLEPILGANLLSENDIIVDCKRCCVHFTDLSVEIKGTVERDRNINSLLPLELNDELTHTPINSPIPSDTKNYINTGSARPIAQRRRRSGGP